MSNATTTGDGAPLPLPARQEHLAALTLGALGVVYGDIGTSPLYAFKESIRERRSRRRPARKLVLGACR